MTRRRAASSVAPASWLTTYSDLVTLLLCFFVLLYSFSTLDAQKFRRFIMSFQGQGVLDGGSVPNTDTTVPEQRPEDRATDVTAPFWADSGRLMVYLQEFLETHGIQAQVQVSQDTQGVMLELRDHLFFDSARADLRPQGLGLLNTLSQLLNQFPNDIAIQGHTDNVPIRTVEFPTNWELSTARAARVVRYFTEVRGLDPRRFAATGHGEHRPLATNATVEGRAQNRRVVFLIKGFE